MTFAERSTFRFASMRPFADTLLMRSVRSTLPNVTAVTSLPRRETNPAPAPPAITTTATTIAILVRRFIFGKAPRARFERAFEAYTDGRVGCFFGSALCFCDALSHSCGQRWHECDAEDSESHHGWDSHVRAWHESRLVDSESDPGMGFRCSA